MEEVRAAYEGCSLLFMQEDTNACQALGSQGFSRDLNACVLYLFLPFLDAYLLCTTLM